jgi:hypothetical protein
VAGKAQFSIKRRILAAFVNKNSPQSALGHLNERAEKG